MMRHSCRERARARRLRVSVAAMQLRAAFMRAAAAALVLVCSVAAGPSLAASTETFNGCQGTTDDPCVRSGSCEIQGAVWDQDVTIDRSDIFDTQGWPGVCDMVHVALVQGNCEPPGATTNVTAHLSPTTFAWIPSIVGPLSCAGTPAPASLSFDDPGSHGEVEVGFFADVTYTVSNGGQSGATSVVFSGLAGDWSIAGGTCGASIAVGASCSIVVRFAPSSVGPSADTLLLDYDDGSGPAATVSRAVSGTGILVPVPALHDSGLWILLAGLSGAAILSLRSRSRACSAAD
jgi:hypothetical protein